MSEGDDPRDPARPRVGRWARAPSLVALAALACCTLPGLTQGDWMRSDGAWYGGIALRAWRTGELWTLTAGDGELYFNKPPLAFWVHGLVLHVFGPGPAQARLPTIAAAALTVLSTVGLMRRLLEGPPDAARPRSRDGRADSATMLAGVMLATTLEFFRRTREISLDMWQLAFMMLAAWIIVAGVRSGRGWMALAAGVPLGLALMTKPLVALAAPALVGAWVLWDHRTRGGGACALAWVVGSAVVGALIALPWHLSMAVLHGSAFTGRYFGAEIAARASGELSAEMGSIKPWWFYLEQIATGGWPWLWAACLGAITWFRGRALVVGERAGRGAASWALVWVVGWLALLSAFPDRRDRYALPVWPALAVLGGVWWASEPWRCCAPVTRWLAKRGAVMFAALGVGLALLPVRWQAPPEEHWIAVEAWLREHPDAEVWTAGWQGPRAARVYLASGTWPRAWTSAGRRPRGPDSAAAPDEPTPGPSTTRLGTPRPDDAAPGRPEPGEPEPGDYVLYHQELGLAPGPGEDVVLAVGHLTLTRVTTGRRGGP